MEKKIFGITVFVQETCLLKAARAFLVFKALEELGEVIVSSPSAQDIEDEHFELDFSVVIITDRSLEEVIAAAENVSEIVGAGADIVVAGSAVFKSSDPAAVIDGMRNCI